MRCNDCTHYDVCYQYDILGEDDNEMCALYEQKRKHGEWIKGKEISRTMLCDKTLHIDYKDFTCSVCGIVLDRLLYHVDGSPFYKFCPNCGADMREGDEE